MNRRGGVGVASQTTSTRSSEQVAHAHKGWNKNLHVFDEAVDVMAMDEREDVK